MTHEEFLNTLAMIRVASSAKEKQALLKTCEEFKEYLFLAYDPMTNFYITSQKFIGNPQPGLESYIPSPTEFEPLFKREITGSNAVRYIYDLCTFMAPKVFEFVMMLIDKDLKLGMNVKSINKVFPGLIPTFNPMLAERENKEKFDLHYSKYPWVYMNEKIDGIRCVVEVQEKECRFSSRTGKPLPGFLTENIERDLIKQKHLIGHVLDAEIAASNFQKLMKVIQRKNVDCDSMMIRNSCKLFVFDVIQPGTLDERLVFMRSIQESTFVKLLPYRRIVTDFGLIKDIAKKYITAGKEGIIIKKPDALYEGKRSFSWMKFKGKESIDLKIIGYEAGEAGSKYESCLGALVLDYEGKELRCGSGFTDEDRVELWSRREELKDMICQITFMEKTKTDSLRHPVFETLRIDKEESDV
jgi:DNA ligase-1